MSRRSPKIMQKKAKHDKAGFSVRDNAVVCHDSETVAIEGSGW